MDLIRRCKCGKEVPIGIEADFIDGHVACRRCWIQHMVLTKATYTSGRPAEVSLVSLQKAQADMREIQLKAIIPVTLGVGIRFEAHGKLFICKKSAANTWSLWQELPRPGHVTPPRVRFGSHDEIKEDVSYVLDIGALPLLARAN